MKSPETLKQRYRKAYNKVVEEQTKQNDLALTPQPNVVKIDGEKLRAKVLAGKASEAEKDLYILCEAHAIKDVDRFMC